MERFQRSNSWDLMVLIMMQSNFDFIHVNDLTPAEVTIALAESKYILGL